MYTYYFNEETKIEKQRGMGLWFIPSRRHEGLMMKKRV